MSFATSNEQKLAPLHCWTVFYRQSGTRFVGPQAPVTTEVGYALPEFENQQPWTGLSRDWVSERKPGKEGEDGLAIDWRFHICWCTVYETK